MKILIIGNGGREHALTWKAAQSPLVKQVFVAPGNAGTAREHKTQNIELKVTDVPALLDFARKEAIDLTIVGPEAALAAGVVDQFQAAGLKCFGPSQAAARLESSKAFSKEFMRNHGIPTAKFATFSDLSAAEEYLNGSQLPIVIKADGLAAGKGVVIAKSREEAMNAVKSMLAEQSFGEAGQKIVIEEFLAGEEASFIVMCDGEHILPLASSQDHKARDNGDLGPNTGGMGAYSPAPVVTSEIHQRIMREVIEPTLAGMKQAKTPYTGFLYAGVMITPEGNPKVLEFNCRLGDPEAQPLMMRLQSDLVGLCLAAVEQRLDRMKIAWDSRPAVGVVLTAEGYPNQYPIGEVIAGLPATEIEDCKVFHAGTALQQDKIITAGGRVLCVTALGANVAAAQQQAYAVATTIHWPHQYYRTDIGYRAIERERSGEKIS